jgi:hypothetical protein
MEVNNILQDALKKMMKEKNYVFIIPDGILGRKKQLLFVFLIKFFSLVMMNG